MVIAFGRIKSRVVVIDGRYSPPSRPEGAHKVGHGSPPAAIRKWSSRTKVPRFVAGIFIGEGARQVCPHYSSGSLDKQLQQQWPRS